MRLTRVYIDAPLAPDVVTELTSQAARHVSRVLRMRVGDTLHLFDDSGRSFRAEIVMINRDCVRVLPRQVVTEEPEPRLHITLVQGISRGQHMDYTIQKAVELGVMRIVPVMTTFSNVRLDEQRAEKRLEHWRNIIINACEQCGRNRLPVIESPVTLDEWLPRENREQKLLLDPAAELPLRGLTPSGNRLSLLTGPEGGLSDAEMEQARSSGFQSVRLGPRILRTETAAVAAITACQVMWGDMD